MIDNFIKGVGLKQRKRQKLIQWLVPPVNESTLVACSQEVCGRFSVKMRLWQELVRVKLRHRTKPKWACFTFYPIIWIFMTYNFSILAWLGLELIWQWWFSWNRWIAWLHQLVIDLQYPFVSPFENDI